MTTAQTILDAAINSSLANDGGTTDLASDTTELLGVLNRFVQAIYTEAALPDEVGGMGRANYFLSSQTVTLGTPSTTWVALPTSPTYLYIPLVLDNAGGPISVVSLLDLRQGTADYPPAVVVAERKIRSAGRSGDPTATAVLTLEGSYLPGDLTSTGHFIGAITPSDSSTTAWPNFVGDRYLIDSMALYLAMKAGDRDTAELQYLTGEADQSAARLAGVLGVSPARLAQVRPT